MCQVPGERESDARACVTAGAIILGKTNIPEFSSGPSDANSSWAGPTLNGVDVRWKPGSSSTGAATAVSAGFGVWSVAEETGGSIQSPATGQSLVGIKPTCATHPACRVSACNCVRYERTPPLQSGTACCCYQAGINAARWLTCGMRHKQSVSQS